MKDKVLRLCKRLDKFTLDEIGTISELNSEVLLPLLEMFVKNKKLIKNVYIYAEILKITKKLGYLELIMMNF